MWAHMPIRFNVNIWTQTIFFLILIPYITTMNFKGNNFNAVEVQALSRLKKIA